MANSILTLPSAVYKAVLGYNVLQAVSYAADSKFPVYVETAKKVHFLFQIIDFSLVFVSFLIASGYLDTLGIDPLITGLATLATIVGAVFLSYKIEKAKEKPEIPENLGTKINASIEQPLSEENLRIALISKMVAMTALSIFFGFSYLNLISIGVSLFSLMQHEWIKYDMDFPVNLNIGNTIINMLYISYFFRKIPNNTDEPCAICNEKPSKQYYFCKNHSFDEACIIGIIYGSIENLLKGRVNIKQIAKQGIYGAVKNVNYEFAISKTNLPNCPLCRQAQRNPEFALVVNEQDNRVFFGSNHLRNGKIVLQ